MFESMPLQTGSVLVDRNGQKVGTVTDVVLEPRTLEPEWYDVKVGRMGGHHLVPAGSVSIDGERGVVPFDQNTIKSAPRTSLPVFEEDKRSLLAHYEAA